MYRLLFPGFGFKIKKQMDFIEFWIICAFVCLNLAVTHIVTDSSTDKRFNGNRSSRPEVFCKKGVLRNFTKFTGKHLYQRLFFNKVAGLRRTTSLKKSLWHKVFSCEICEISKSRFFYRTPRTFRLLLIAIWSIGFIHW